MQNHYKITKTTPNTKTDIHTRIKGYSVAKYILKDTEKNYKGETEILFKSRNEFSVYQGSDLYTYKIEKE